MFPALGKDDKKTNIIVFQKVHYLRRGAAPRPLAPPARSIRPPLAPLPRAGAGAGGSQADADSRAPGKIESNMVKEEVSFAITSEE